MRKIDPDHPRTYAEELEEQKATAEELEYQKEKLKQNCEKAGIKIEAFDKLIEYYRHEVGWGRIHAYEYINELFYNGTIQEIKKLEL